MSKKFEPEADTKGATPPSALAREIDANLRRVYQETLEEGVPDRFTQLLAALKAKETGGRGDAG
jgi:hypothetical protein